MIDTLENKKATAASLSLEDIIRDNSVNETWKSIGKVEEDKFALMTLHRPSNVDSKEILEPIVRFMIDEVTPEMPLIWTVHPRTRKMLDNFGLLDEVMNNKNLMLLEPLGYLEMLKLNMHARVILTDSGGLQEECTVLGTPCLTMRWNTERPITLREHGGASVLVGNSIRTIREEFIAAVKKPRIPIHPELWDGKTAERCLQEIINYNSRLH